MPTFSESAIWNNVEKFTNTSFITNEETNASISYTVAPILGIYVTSTNGAGGNVVFINGNNIKIACITSTQFTLSQILYTISTIGYIATLSNISVTLGSNSLPLQQLVNRDNYLLSNSGSDLIKIGSTLYLRNGSSLTTVSCISIDHGILKVGTTIYLYSASNTTIGQAAVDHNLIYTSGTFSLVNAQGVTLSSFGNIGEGIGLIPGMIAIFATSSIPTGWLPCNGAAIDRTQYATLFSKIGIYYGAGNGTTTFNIPDLRGVFVRGLDQSRGLDSGRVLGSYQADEFLAHNHNVHYTANSGDEGSYPMQAGIDRGDGFAVVYSPYTTQGGNETRPKNVAMIYCIKI